MNRELCLATRSGLATATGRTERGVSGPGRRSSLTAIVCSGNLGGEPL